MAPVAGKLKPPAINRMTMNNKGLKQTSSQEVECTNTNQEISPPKKRKSPSETSALDSADSFEATAATSWPVFLLCCSERAAADTSQMEELEVILTEARNLETSLKEKKNHLRQTLALISDKLQG
uniref:Uncharacterized protein n=1 Tax=Amphilophus citrinellus TaxID=61819 RepID=A0A3Q0R6P6_AMPCI